LEEIEEFAGNIHDSIVLHRFDGSHAAVLTPKHANYKTWNSDSRFLVLKSTTLSMQQSTRLQVNVLIFSGM